MSGRGTRRRAWADAGRLRRLPSSAEEHACPGQGRYGCGRKGSPGRGPRKNEDTATERNERYHCLEAVGAAGQACGTGPAASSEDRESVRHAGGASAGSGRPAGDGRRGRYPRRDQKDDGTEEKETKKNVPDRAS